MLRRMKYLILLIAIMIVAVLYGYLSMPPMPNVPDRKPVECGAVTSLESHTANNLLQHYRIAGVPDAEHWVCVAILESGWEVQSELAVKHNNPVGMRSRPHFKWINTADGDYCSYPTMSAHALDLRKWCLIAPRKQGETFVAFLRRRGYNTDATYYKKFNEINKIYNQW